MALGFLNILNISVRLRHHKIIYKLYEPRTKEGITKMGRANIVKIKLLRSKNNNLTKSLLTHFDAENVSPEYVINFF